MWEYTSNYQTYLLCYKQEEVGNGALDPTSQWVKAFDRLFQQQSTLLREVTCPNYRVSLRVAYDLTLTDCLEMSKTKSSSKVAKPTKSDILTKTKDAGITKPSKDGKSKSKAIAKEVAVKEEKKSKKSKKVKEPTPEPSSDESDSDESASSESESEAEVKPTKVANGKATKAAGADSDSDSSSDSSADEAPAPKKGDKKVNGAAKKVAAVEASDSDSDSDSDDESAPGAVLGSAPAVDAVSESDSDSSDDEAPAKSNGVKAAKDDSDSDSDSSEDDEEDETPAVKTNKRKADDEEESTTKKPKVENNGNKNLFVGNLSWNVDEAWLTSEFEVFGELSGARIVTDRESGRSKGFGYVEYTNAEDAAKAYAEKKDSDLDGRTINLDWATVRPDNKDKQEDRRKSYGDQLSEPSDTLFVGNLAFDVGQEEVSEAFTPFGTISSCRLPTDINTGMAKGFGYVTFSSVEEAKAGLEAMQGGYIGSRPVRLDYSQPRPPREDGGFGGRGGGGRGRGFGDRGRGGRGGGRGFGDRGRGGRGGGRGFGDRGGRGGRGGSTNRGGFGDFQGRKQTFD